MNEFYCKCRPNIMYDQVCAYQCDHCKEFQPIQVEQAVVPPVPIDDNRKEYWNKEFLGDKPVEQESKPDWYCLWNIFEIGGRHCKNQCDRCKGKEQPTEQHDNFYCKEYDKNGYTCEEQCPACKKTNDFTMEPEQQDWKEKLKDWLLDNLTFQQMPKGQIVIDHVDRYIVTPLQQLNAFREKQITKLEKEIERLNNELTLNK